MEYIRSLKGENNFTIGRNFYHSADDVFEGFVISDDEIIELMKKSGLEYDDENDLFYHPKHGALMFDFPEELVEVFFPEFFKNNETDILKAIEREKNICATIGINYNKQYKRILKSTNKKIMDSKKLGYELSIGPGTIYNVSIGLGEPTYHSSKYAVYCKNYKKFLNNEKTR